MFTFLRITEKTVPNCEPILAFPFAKHTHDPLESLICSPSSGGFFFPWASVGSAQRLSMRDCKPLFYAPCSVPSLAGIRTAKYIARGMESVAVPTGGNFM